MKSLCIMNFIQYIIINYIIDIKFILIFLNRFLYMFRSSFSLKINSNKINFKILFCEFCVYLKYIFIYLYLYYKDLYV